MKVNTSKNRFILAIVCSLPSYYLLYLIRGYDISEMEWYAHLQYSAIVFGILVCLLEVQNLKSRVLEDFFAWRAYPRTRGALEFVFTILITPVIVTTFMIILYEYIWEMGVWWPGIIEYNLFALLFSVLIIGFVNIDVVIHEWKKSLLKNEILEKETIKAKLGTLQAQISPHFLFNNFNVVSSLIQDNQQLAQKYIDQLSGVYRYVLTTKKEELVPLYKELEFIEKYLFLLKVRFDDHISCHIDIQNHHKYEVPPATLQILVENAVKHNEISSRSPLEIKITQNEDILTVENKLQKKKSTSVKSTGIGLENLKERYSYLSDKKIFIEASNDSFSVTIPLLTYT